MKYFDGLLRHVLRTGGNTALCRSLAILAKRAASACLLFLAAVMWMPPAIASGESRAPEAKANLLADVRLVLGDGHVVGIDSHGRLLPGKPTKLQLGTEAASIHSVVVDLSFDRLYVTPETDYRTRHTRVFRLSTLAPLGILPGVTEVKIPKQESAAALATFRYDAAPDARSLEGIQELHDNAPAKVELRARSQPGRTLAAGEDWQLHWSHFECYSPHSQGFRDIRIDRIVDRDLTFRQLDASNAPLPVLEVKGCWSDGSIWGVVEREPRQTDPIVGQISIFGDDLTELAAISAAREHPIGSLKAVEIGKTPGVIVLFDSVVAPTDPSAVGTLYRIGTPGSIPLRAIEMVELHAEGYSLLAAGTSRHWAESYLVPARFLKNSLLRRRLDRVFLLTAGDGDPLREVRLPEELQLIGRANRIRLDPQLTDAERADRLERLPSTTQDLSAVKVVEIVHVLPGSGR